MKITIITALAATVLAFAPLAHAGEGQGEPFPFSAGPISVVRFTADGVAVALPDQPALAARDGAILQSTAEVAELPAKPSAGEGNHNR